MPERVRTFQDIYTAAMRMMKIPTTDTDALNFCKQSINMRYDSVVFRQKWRWRRRQWDFRVPIRIIAGTVTFTAGSREITGAGTGWTADNVGWWIQRDSDDEMYQILAINVATQVAQMSSLYTGTTGAAATYQIFQFQFGLVPDCEEVDLVWHDHYRYPVELRSPREIKEMVMGNPGTRGWAWACTVDGVDDYAGPLLGQFLLAIDYLGGTGEDDLKMSIFPHIPDESYTLHLEYMVKVLPLDADADEPVLPLEKRHVLVYGALADMFFRERIDETGRFWEAKFAETLKDMEKDVEFTDERPRLGVDMRRYRGRNKTRIDPALADLGSFFDRS